MSRTDTIHCAFCVSGRKPLIALDWESNIAPLIGKGRDVQFLTLIGDSVDSLVEQLKDNQQLPTARHIVFELIISPAYEFPFSNIAPLSNYLATIPSNTEISWGCSRYPELSENLKLIIIFI